jgi:uncharacterized protein (UPF0261 family)
MVNFGHLDSVPQHYKDRKLYSWAPDVTLMRTNVIENEIFGKELAEKVNVSSGLVSIILPTKGVSQVDRAGDVFYDPDSDNALFDSIKKHAGENVAVVECELHINDPAFAEILVKKLLEMIIHKI